MPSPRMHWTAGSVGLAIQMSAFHPRDWSKDGHVTLTRPICIYPEAGSWTLDKRDLLWFDWIISLNSLPLLRSTPIAL